MTVTREAPNRGDPLADLERAWRRWDSSPAALERALAMEQACAVVAPELGLTVSQLREELASFRHRHLGYPTALDELAGRCTPAPAAVTPPRHAGAHASAIARRGRYGAVGPDLDPAPAHLGQLVDLALAAGVEQLWVTPAAAAAWGLPERARVDVDERGKGTEHPFAAGALGYRLDVTVDGKRGSTPALGPWIEGRPDPMPGRHREAAVVFPAWMGKADWRRVLARSTPEQLVGSLQAVEEALGAPWHRSGGSTGRRLMRAVHGKGGADPGPLEGLPDDLPGSEGAWVWARRPEAPRCNLAGERWVWCLDTNGAYLAACSRLRLGWGPARHLERPHFDPRRPGYWRLDRPLRPPGGPPHPFPAGRWVTTPTLELAAELHLGAEITEAWVWDEARDWLTPWYERLRDARLAVADDPLALATVKWCYTGGRGWLGAGYGGPARPDWADLIAAKARANLWRRCGKNHLRPFAVDVDAVYVVSEDCPVLTDPLALGRWKLKGRAPLGAVLDLGAPDRGRPRPYLDAMRGLLGG